MEIGRIQGATRVVGKSQGYRGLPIKDEVIECPTTGKKTPVMSTAWIPTMEELAALVAGAPIYVQIQGTQHPPILLTTGDPPQ